MLILEPRSAIPGASLPDVREDWQAARRAAQYRVSDRAFYFPAFPANQYILFTSLTDVVLRSASLPTTGCCGKELPVLKLTLRFEDGEREFVIDPPKHADTILMRIQAARPDLDVDNRR